RHLDVETEGVAQDLSWGDRRIRRLAGIILHARLRRPKAPLPNPGSDCRIAVDIPDRLAAAGRSRLRDPGRSGDAGESRGIAPRHGARSADLVALSRLAGPRAAR